MMVECSDFFEYLRESGIEFFTGVPDSLLKSICAYISDNVPSERHIIAANEGASVGMALGYHLATGKLPLVYLQNSGLGNLINPLLSLADRDVYSVPMMLLIGWRGEPGVKDEPQHIKQGVVTLSTLEALDIPHIIIDHETDYSSKLDPLLERARRESRPVAVVVRKNTFQGYKLKQVIPQISNDTREDAISMIAEALSEKDLIVSTTGMASRELFEYRKNNNQTHDKDFLTVGGMGHASQIALGIATNIKNRTVVCIDGDGSALMHLGSLAINGQNGTRNFKHIVLNNAAHDSVGGQPTVAQKVSLTSIAEASGYRWIMRCSNLAELESSLDDFLHSVGPSFLEVAVARGSRTDLGRPTTTPIDNKIAFMKNIKGE